MGEEWKGGDMNNPGGAYKINLLKKEMEQFKHRDNLILMFTDSYDVLILGKQDDILKRFHNFDAKVVFGAEPFCWPDETLKDDYPEVVLGNVEKSTLPNQTPQIGNKNEPNNYSTTREGVIRINSHIIIGKFSKFS